MKTTLQEADEATIKHTVRECDNYSSCVMCVDKSYYIVLFKKVEKKSCGYGPFKTLDKAIEAQQKVHPNAGIVC